MGWGKSAAKMIVNANHRLRLGHVAFVIKPSLAAATMQLLIDFKE